MDNDVFKSLVRDKGDLGGVFEYDGDTGYFYLYNLSASANSKIRGGICIFPGPTFVDESKISIKWNKRQNIVSLVIDGLIWAAFEENGTPHGGRYTEGRTSSVGQKIIEQFL